MPSLITAGPDDTLWCTLNQAGAIARITPAPRPVLPPARHRRDTGRRLLGHAVGHRSVVRLARDGSLAEEISFQPRSEPHGIALGSGGSIWVALEAGFLAHLIP